jgi:hypothetical protein
MPTISFSSRHGKSNIDIKRIKPERHKLPDWANAEVQYHYEDWIKLRDAADSERVIKTAAETYLPRFPGMDAAEYAGYLQRASYYNFTGRTIKALAGRLLRRRPVPENFPEKLEGDLSSITYDNESFRILYKRTTREIIHMGRHGILLDIPAKATTGRPRPYFACYNAENIIDWEVEEVKTGPQPEAPVRSVPTRVVLREFKPKTFDSMPTTPVTAQKKAAAYDGDLFYATYRELLLVNGVYTVKIYKSDDETDAEMDEAYLAETIVPAVRGKTFNYIPFHIFGAADGGPSIETSPMLPIVEINLSHYRSYAHLEHGRYYTGFPIYYADSSAADGHQYEIGPNRVWEMEKGSKAGLIEFNGQGLKFLENAMTQKEAQAASLGGRLIGVTAQSVSESGDQVKMKELNEQALLLDVALQLDDGFTKLMRWWLAWSGIAQAEADTYSIEFNKDFLLDGAGAREFRAIHAMYKDGVVPIEVVYDYFRKFEVIPDHLEMDAFRKLLEQAESFPQQPDATARLDGFTDAKTQLNEEVREENVEREEKHRAEDKAEQAKLAEQAAKNPAPGNPANAPARLPPKNTKSRA